MEFVGAVFTPFNDDEERTINYDVIPKYAEYLASMRIKYILVNGTTGEGVSLTLAERKQTTEAWKKECEKHGFKMMVQIGGTNLSGVKELAIHAEKTGVDSLLCLPDLYFKPETADDLARYYEIVCKMVPKIPVYMYYKPGNTNANMIEFLEKMKPVENFAGLKYASLSMIEASDLAHFEPNRYKVYMSKEKIMVASHAQGITNFNLLSLGVFPMDIANVIHPLLKGEQEKAKIAQLRINKIYDTVAKYGYVVSSMKEAMNIVSPIYVGHPRPPLKTLTATEIEQLREDLKQFSN